MAFCVSFSVLEYLTKSHFCQKILLTDMLHNLWHFSEAAMVLVSSFEVEVELSEKVKLNSFTLSCSVNHSSFITQKTPLLYA